MNDNSQKKTIGPEIKISDLLENYPELENVLIDIAPVFKKLKNPVLRRTVAKVTNLRQAAQVGGVSLADLINQLRSAAGEEHNEGLIDELQENSNSIPDWLDDSKIVISKDVRPMLEAGENPMAVVMSGLKELKADEIYELITSFVPVPLKEKAEKQGCYTWSKEENQNDIRTFFICNK